MKRSCLLILLAVAPFLTVLSQEKSMGQLEKEYREYLEKSNRDFSEYVSRTDMEFSRYLARYWEEMKLLAGRKTDTHPKPSEAPSFAPSDSRPQFRSLQPLPGNQKPGLSHLPPIPLLTISPVSEESSRQTEFPFYGVNVSLHYHPGILIAPPAEISNKTIAGYWERMSNAHYSDLLTELERERTGMQLGDWGYLQLVRSAAAHILPGSENGINLLTWYLMSKSGYRIKIGYNGNSTSLMIPSEGTLYGLDYVNINGVNYYVMGKSPGKITTYEKDFPGSERMFDLNIITTMNLGKQEEARTVRFNYGNKPFEVTLKFNSNYIEFFRDYPLTDLPVRFNSAVSGVFKESVNENLKPLLSGKSDKEAAAFLLSMVQNGFGYKSDEMQFGGTDKFNFPEENLFYQSNDCDDRTILFCWLAENIAGLDVVALDFPGHMAAGVQVNEEISGITLNRNGKQYTVADPTYIDAPLGVIMPQYAGKEPVVIDLDILLTSGRQVDLVWDKMMLAGGFPGDNKQNYYSDTNGGYYLTGYFRDEISSGETTLRSAGSNDIFFL